MVTAQRAAESGTDGIRRSPHRRSAFGPAQHSKSTADFQTAWSVQSGRLHRRCNRDVRRGGSSPALTALGACASRMLPVPSWPLELNPQHTAPPPATAAQVCRLPAAMAAAAAIPAAAGRCQLRAPPNQGSGGAKFACIPRFIGISRRRGDSCGRGPLSAPGSGSSPDPMIGHCPRAPWPRSTTTRTRPASARNSETAGRQLCSGEYRAAGAGSSPAIPRPAASGQRVRGASG